MKKQKRFSQLTLIDRIKYLLRLKRISSAESKKLLTGETLTTSLAELLIENALGYYQIPLGIAVNFVIDGKPYIIPMAIEETSVIAAASKTAKWIAEQGIITTSVSGTCNIGQIHFYPIKDLEKFEKIINLNKVSLIKEMNSTVAANMVKRGGGVDDIVLRIIPHVNDVAHVVLHLHINTCEAMGANAINQICEYMKKPLEQLTQEKIAFTILSNLCDTKLTSVKIILSGIDLALAKAIELAAFIGEIDPYRAATNNKGIMNGIDAVLIATGNDWRSVEAAIHAYCVRDHQYRSIAHWEIENNNLVGTMEAPINVGIVGGVTTIHPTAQMAIRILNVSNANELSRVIAAVGLVQNLGALRALVSDGICKGHMKLHIDNLCLMHGCKPKDIGKLKGHLQQELNQSGYLSSDKIKELLTKLSQK